jgi:hypothetical protein
MSAGLPRPHPPSPCYGGAAGAPRAIPALIEVEQHANHFPCRIGVHVAVMLSTASTDRNQNRIGGQLDAKFSRHGRPEFRAAELVQEGAKCRAIRQFAERETPA